MAVFIFYAFVLNLKQKYHLFLYNTYLLFFLISVKYYHEQKSVEIMSSNIFNIVYIISDIRQELEKDATLQR